MLKINGKLAFILISFLTIIALTICSAYAFSSPSILINSNISFNAPPGSEGNPYLINSIDDFNNLINTYKNDSATHLKLNCNLSEENGTLLRVDFNGNLDLNNNTIEIKNFPLFNSIGNNGTVKNAKLNVLSVDESLTHFGALAHEASGTIMNCSLNAFTPTTLNSINYFGGIIYRSLGATIINCSNNANLSLTFAKQVRFGAIIGETLDSSVISGCENNGTISIISNSSTNCYFGGLVGYSSKNDALIEFINCKNNAPISVNSPATSSNYYSRLGGLLGGATSSVNINMRKCSNLANLNCTNNTNNSGYSVQLGGLIAYLFGTTNNTAIISIENCYSSGDLTGQNSAGGAVYVGGLIGYGYSDNKTDNKNSTINIKTSYTCGKLSASSNNTSVAGGLIGQSAKTTLISCFSSANIVSANTIGGLIGKYVNKFSSFPCTLINCLGNTLITYFINSDDKGGLIGYSDGAPLLTDCHFNNTIENYDFITNGVDRAVGNISNTEYGANNLAPFFDSFFSHTTYPWNFEIWRQSNENPLELSFY